MPQVFNLPNLPSYAFQTRMDFQCPQIRVAGLFIVPQHDMAMPKVGGCGKMPRIDFQRPGAFPDAVQVSGHETMGDRQLVMSFREIRGASNRHAESLNGLRVATASNRLYGIGK